jgi:hypothetical protein
MCAGVCLQAFVVQAVQAPNVAATPRDTISLRRHVPPTWSHASAPKTARCIVCAATTLQASASVLHVSHRPPFPGHGAYLCYKDVVYLMFTPWRICPICTTVRGTVVKPRQEL